MSEHRSIGDVLDLLKPEFPDVTVSKIRFLESQGLIAPERTPSGYRKFYEPDVDRLRWILTQQRDHYLPLKVIRSRLAQIEEDDAAALAEEAPAAAVEALSELSVGGPEGGGGPGTDPDDARDGTGGIAGPGESEADPPDGSASNLSREELVEATGLDEQVLRELEKYGLLPAPTATDDGPRYDDQALVVARLARGFLRHGVEPRHLRMYKTFGEREAAFVGQLVTPMLRQRNPEARRQARETVTELARLGGGLRAAMLRLALRDEIGE